MRTLLVALLVFACAGALLPWYPFSSEALWPVGMVARELWPWLLVANLLGLLLAHRRWRVLRLVFLAGAAAALWPLLQLTLLERDFARAWAAQGLPADALHAAGVGAVLETAFGGYADTRVEPEVLEHGIHYYRPQARSGQRPILIDIHGGSWQHGGPRDDAYFTSHFANAGWAVFSLEYRLAPQFKHPAQIDDVRAAIDWIYEHARGLGADPERIALAGRSAGGHLAMLAAYAGVRAPVRAVVNYYGPGDLEAIYREHLLPDPLDRNDKVEALLGGSPDERPDAYRDASPSSYLRDGLPPTLHVQGAHDHIVGAALTRRFHERLLASGTRSLFLELPWSDHSFDFVRFGPASTLSLAYVESFLDVTTASRVEAAQPAAAGIETLAERAPFAHSSAAAAAFRR